MNYHTFFDIDSIPNPKTRELFKEVLSSYVNENYRSAIVMLYSVTICDLIYKLIDLYDIYSDKTAADILSEVSSFSDETTRRNWERTLIEKIHKRTDLLSQESCDAIERLHQVRNYAAHPTFSASFELSVPSKEATIAHMKEMLYHILTRPCYFGKNEIDSMTEDLDRFRESFDQGYEQWKGFLVRRYYSQIRPERVAPWFVSLWSLCFMKPDVEKCNHNREQLEYALRALLDSHKHDCISALIREASRYGVDPSDTTVRSAINVLIFHPDLFRHLNEEAQSVIHAAARKDINLLALAFFLADSFGDHMTKLDEKINEICFAHKTISPQVAERLFMIATDNGMKETLLDHYIAWYGRSGQYDTANERFDALVAPFLSHMEQRHFEALFFVTNQNSQIYGRRNSFWANSEIIEQAKEKIDCSGILERYPNFKFNISLLEKESQPVPFQGEIEHAQQPAPGSVDATYSTPS